jgi:hypothetical protein
MRTRFRLESLKGGDHSEDLGVDGDNIKDGSYEVGFYGVDWNHLAQKKD